MDYLLGFFCLLLALVYVYFGMRLFVLLDKTGPTRFENDLADQSISWLLAGFAVAWPVILLLTALQQPQLFKHLINYQARIRLFRWVFIVGCLLWLGYCGHNVREKLQPLPEVSPTSTIEYGPAQQ